MCEYWRRMFGKKSGVFLLQSIIRRQLRKGNMELPCRVPWERSYWNSWERSSLATSTEKMNGKKSKKSNQEKQFVRSDFFASFVRCNARCKRNMQIEIHHTIHPHPEDLLLNHKTFKNYMNKWCLQPRYALRGWVKSITNYYRIMGFHVSLFPTKFTLCSSVPWKYFVDFGFPCSPNNAFVPVFPVLFSLCSYVTKKLNGHVPLFPKTPERGLPSGCKNTSIRTLSTGSFSLTPVWKRKL